MKRMILIQSEKKKFGKDTRKDTTEDKITGGDYLSLALYAFMGLGMEGIYAYLLVERDLRKAYGVLFLMFVL